MSPLTLAELFPAVASPPSGLRYLAVAVAVAWAIRIARGHTSSLAPGLGFYAIVMGAWLAALGRPYGLFVDAAVTRRLAQAAVAVATGSSSESFLSGEPAGPVSWTSLAWLGVPAPAALLAPTLLPLVGVPLAALVVRWLWSRRDLAPLAALLVLLGAAADLTSLRGDGLATEAWSRPAAALALPVVAAAVLVVARTRRSAAVLAAATGAAAGALLPVGATLALSGPETLLALTLDQGVAGLLAIAALRRRRDAAVCGLLASGAVLTLAAHTGAAVDAWSGLGLWRLGVLLAASEPLSKALRRAAELLPDAWGVAPERRLSVTTAGLVLTLAAAATPLWWSPARFDPVAHASTRPLSRNVAAAMDWIARETPPESVFIAGRDYAPHVAALAGRRVLRAPGLAEPPDDERRRRLERRVLQGRPAGPLGDRYGIAYVFAAPGEFVEYGLDAPEQLVERGLRVVHTAPGRLFVLRLAPAPGNDEADTQATRVAQKARTAEAIRVTASSGSSG